MTTAPVPASAVLEGLLAEAGSEVTLGWILDRLETRSFGLVVLLLSFIALIPGLSIPMGLLLTVPALQMALAHDAPVLPARLARRRVATRRLAAMIARLVPPLRWIETFIRPRWATPLRATKRVVGVVVLLLGLTLVGPIPFSHLLPAGMILLLALAYLEEDGLLLCLALAGAGVSLAITAATVWLTVVGIDYLGRQ